MTVLLGCLFGLLSTIPLVVPVEAFAIQVAKNIQLETAPLIGGPLWLPLHVKVVVDDCNTFDFVPLDAASPSTLQKLLSLQAVPAEARARTEMKNGNNLSSQRANDFCDRYTKDLHLINNNCWTFAFDLVRLLLEDDCGGQDFEHS